MIAECEAALQEAIDAFAQEYADATQRAFEEGVYAKLKELYPTESEDQLKARLDKQLKFIEEHAEDSALDLENALKAQLTEEDPTLGEEDNKSKLSEAFDASLKVFEEVYLPLYSDKYNGKNLALFEIGYLPKSALKQFGVAEETEEGTTEGEGTEGEGTTDTETPEEDGPVAGEYASYYEFVFAAKFQAPYYAAFGTPA